MIVSLFIAVILLCLLAFGLGAMVLIQSKVAYDTYIQKIDEKQALAEMHLDDIRKWAKSQWPVKEEGK